MAKDFTVLYLVFPRDVHDVSHVSHHKTVQLFDL